MDISDFDFTLPQELIAQAPPVHRGESRLLVLNRETGEVADRQFRDLGELLGPGDLLVTNDTRVFAARLLGRRLPGGGAAECLLVRRADDEVRDGPASSRDGLLQEADTQSEVWEALVHPGQRLKEGSRVEFGGAGAPVIHGEVLARHFHGRRRVRLWTESGDLSDAIEAIGHVPLPPYIKRLDSLADRERYQTVYARVRGSIAAPTAGLHFTPEMLSELEARGVERATVTLHVGYGTFQPVRTEHVEDHTMDEEQYDVSPRTAAAVSDALARGRRVIAVGTTTTRTLESLRMSGDGRVQPGAGSTNLFIFPGYRYRIVSGLLTNFHLPRSSLLLLVSALAGREKVMAAYRHAVADRYRFYSYGDAMLIT